MAKHWWARTLVGRTAVSDPLQPDEQPDARFEAEWRPRVKARGLIMLGCLGVWAVGIEGQLVRLQVLQQAHYTTLADAQHEERVALEAPRGDILDRNGRALATTVESFELGADPTAVSNPAAEARELCAALGDCSPEDLASTTAKLGTMTKSGKPAKWVLIRKASDMSYDAATNVQALIRRLAEANAKVNAKLKPKDQKRVALTLRPLGQRYYPNKELAAQVVGVVSADGTTGTGVELGRNDDLRGVPGQALVLMDGHNREMISRVTREPRPGASVELTLDIELQHFAQRELDAAVQDSGAIAGTVIVLQAGTGEVLADASYPPFNPNLYRYASGESVRNRAVQDTYEPGSTFKMITLSAAIDAGVLTPTSLIDCSPGSLRIAGRAKPISEAHGQSYGTLSLEDVLVKSSNRGAAQIGLRVGAETMSQYVRRFPFGQRISDLPSEEPGKVEPVSRLGDNALASMSFGYQIAVTPMQMAVAASVFANGGVLIKPHVVRAVIRDGKRTEVATEVVRRVVTPETALTMTAMLENVVARGTGRAAASVRYLVAGKTGTAMVAAHGYSGQNNNVSFIGFVPSRQPEFIILVLLNSPRGGSSSGGAIAAPVFKRIAEAALVYTGVPPSINPVPPIIVAADRSPLLTPPAPAATVQPIRMAVDGRPIMPDLRGMTAREAARVTNAVGLSLSVYGEGVVVSQSPAPGEAIGAANHGVLQLRREPAKPGGPDR